MIGTAMRTILLFAKNENATPVFLTKLNDNRLSIKTMSCELKIFSNRIFNTLSTTMTKQTIHKMFNLYLFRFLVFKR